MYRSEEDYLKQIYELTIENGKEQVRNVDLAERLGHSVQSINEKIKRLEAKEYVVFEPYKGVSLTPSGMKEALRMVRAHRLWEVFLYQELDFSWSDLHQDAEELEHASSEQVIAGLYKRLEEPKYCYHGNPIPDLDGNIHPIALRTLASCQVGEEFLLNRVLDQKELLQFLDERQMKLGSKLVIIEKNQFADIIVVSHDNQLLQISTTIAKLIFTF